MTGDNHFGKKYDRYQDIKSKLTESRFDSLKRMIEKADEECCDIFAVTGDLFESINTAKTEVEKAVNILGSFSGTVLILPGNHDYYTGSEKVWKYYDDASGKFSNDTAALRKAENRRRELENKLKGMNLSAKIKKLGSADISVRSAVSGELIVIGDEPVYISEAVIISIPDVAEIELSPKNIDTEKVMSELSEVNDTIAVLH